MYRKHKPLSSHPLVDHLLVHFQVTTDAELASILRLHPPCISKIRNRRMAISSGVLLRMHETSDISLKALRFLAGDYREHTGHAARVCTEREADLYLQQEFGKSESVSDR